MTSRQKQPATTNITIKRALLTVIIVESFGILVIFAINVHISPRHDPKSFKVIVVGINGHPYNVSSSYWFLETYRISCITPVLCMLQEPQGRNKMATG